VCNNPHQKALIEALIAGGMEPAAAALMMFNALQEVPSPRSKHAIAQAKYQKKIDDQKHQNDHSDQNEKVGLIEDIILSIDSSKKVSKKVSKKDPKILLPDQWEPSQAHFDHAAKLNLPQEFVLEKAARMRGWSHSTDTKRTLRGWGATLHDWIDKEEKNVNRTYQSNSMEASRKSQGGGMAALGRGAARIFEKGIHSGSETAPAFALQLTSNTGTEGRN